MRKKYIPRYVRKDGGFCVTAKFTTTQDAVNLQNQVVDFCVQWIEETRKRWQRPHVKPTSQNYNDPWDYSDIFIGLPYIAKAEGNQLWLRLDARVYSYWWKDWCFGLTFDLRRAFPELKRSDRVSFDCDEATD